MGRSNFLEFARQGNVEAIAALLSFKLQTDGITIHKATIKEHCLQLMLELQNSIDRKQVVGLLTQLIKNLQSQSFDKVKLHVYIAGEDFPEWTEEIELNKIPLYNRSISLNNINSSLNPVTQKLEAQKNKFIEDIRTFKFSSVVPYQEALNSKLYRSNAVQLLLYFGLFPSAIAIFSGNSDLEKIAWILGIYYASIWGVILYHIIKPGHFSWKATLKFVFFTAFVGIPILFIFQKIPPFNLLYNFLNSPSLLLRGIGFILGVGLLEELCKGLPVYIFLLRPGKLQEPLTPAFYGAMSGLGFAISEGVNYSFQNAFFLRQGNLDFGGYLLTSTIRFIPLPLIHAIFAGIVGYFLGLAAINRSRQGAIIFIGVTISAILHGLYDVFASSLIGLGILVFSILLFVTYLRRSKEMIREMEQAEIEYRDRFIS